MTLLLNDYFRRYGIGIAALFLALITMSFLASLIEEDTQIALLGGTDHGDMNILQRTMFMVTVFALIGRTFVAHMGPILALGVFMLAMAEIGAAWPRVALTLPLSRKTIATTLWVECVIIPTVILSLGMLIVLGFEVSETLYTDFASSTTLPNVFWGSFLFTGVACFYVQIIDVIAAGYTGTKRSEVKRFGIIVIITIFFIVFLGMGIESFIRWDESSILDALLTVAALGMTAQSFRNRQSLVYLFESFRSNLRREEQQPLFNARQENLPRSPGFLGSYRRTSLWLIAATSAFCVFWLPFMLWEKQAIENGLEGEYLAFAQNPENVLFLFVVFWIPLVAIFVSTPPLSVCRLLPLSTTQLFIRLIAGPLFLFAACTLNVLILVHFFTAWEVFHALAISWFVMGIGVFIIGYVLVVKEETIGVTVTLVVGAVILGFIFYGAALFEFFIELAQVPSNLAIAGTVCLAVGSAMWYAGIAHGSVAYQPRNNRDVGKIMP